MSYLLILIFFCYYFFDRTILNKKIAQNRKNKILAGFTNQDFYKSQKKKSPNSTPKNKREKKSPEIHCQKHEFQYHAADDNSMNNGNIDNVKIKKLNK